MKTETYAEVMDLTKEVKGLINGPKIVLQMSKDVNSFIRTILGFIRAERTLVKQRNVVGSQTSAFSITFGRTTVNSERELFTESNRQWEICNHHDEITVRCYSKDGSNWNLIYSSYEAEVSFFEDHVQMVYEGLPYFLEKVKEAYPGIHNRWQYLLRAAEK